LHLSTIFTKLSTVVDFVEQFLEEKAFI